MIGFMAVEILEMLLKAWKCSPYISGYNAATGAQNPQPYLGRKPADIDTTSGND